jgi:hypothetical protein
MRSNSTPARRQATPKQESFNLDLRDAKPAVIKVSKAAGTGNMSECIRQVFMQLQREMERRGVTSLVYSDITIDPK